jgi:hypothetical protein
MPQAETKVAAKPVETVKSQPLETVKSQPVEASKSQPLETSKPQLEAKPTVRPANPAPEPTRPNPLEQAQMGAQNKSNPVVESTQPAKPQTAPSAESKPNLLEQAQMGSKPTPIGEETSKPNKNPGLNAPKTESAAKPAAPTAEKAADVAPAQRKTNANPGLKTEPSAETKAGNAEAKGVKTNEVAKAFTGPVAEAPAKAPESAKPLETSKPQPVETSKPQPVETSKPQPVETSKPQPVETSKPQPVETSKSQPEADSSRLASKATANREGLECAVVVDARGLNPPLSPSPSPAVLDPNGHKVWPNPEAVKGISSDLVDRTSIALYFQNPGEVQADQYTKVLRLKAQSTKPSEFATQSRFNDYAVVSGTDAGKIASAGLACQMIFLR